MPHFYKRRLGSRRCIDFSEENVQAMITTIQEGMLWREADKVFGVPKTTLGQRLKGASNKPVQPPVLTVEEEWNGEQNIWRESSIAATLAQA